VDAASCISLTIAVILFVAGWTTLLLDFRVEVLKMRRGISDFDASKIKFKDSFKFPGAVISNMLLNLVVIHVLVMVIILIFGWSFTWGYIAFYLHKHLGSLVIVLIMAPLSALLTFYVSKHIGKKRTIEHRVGWNNFDLLHVVTGSVSGVGLAITRIALSFAALVLSLSRIDRSAFAHWLDQIVVLDALAKSYRATVIMHHNHCNPCMHVFIKRLIEGAAARRAAAECGDDSYAPVGSAKLRAANRWRKAVLCVYNPVVSATKWVPQDTEEEAAELEKKKKVGCVAKLKAKLQRRTNAKVQDGAV